MSDADIAKNLLLGKDLFQVYKGSYTIKFFIRYTKENESACKKFLKQISKFITQTHRSKNYWYLFNSPYGDSIMLLEIRNERSSYIDDIYGRWEYFEKFTLKKE